MSRVVIVGGGLAGIAAAMRLARNGLKPILIESRKKLGGRATSFIDPRTNEVLDNCQHVVMGCCTNLLALYSELGVLDRIQWHGATYWANPPHAHDRLQAGWFPAPTHFTESFLKLRMLSVGDKVSIARAMWRLIRMGRAGRLAWRGRTFLEFLIETRQTQRACELFWEPIVVSSCNLPCSRVDAPCAMQVMQEGFLSHRFASAMGLSTVPLLSLYDAAQSKIEAAGGSVRLGVSAQSLAFDGRRVTGVVTDEGLVEGASFVIAVPCDRLDRLCSESMKKADRRLQHLAEIRHSPILGVHLVYASPVLNTPHLVLPGRPTQWLFNKGTDSNGRQMIHAVISAADDWMEFSESEIARRVHEDVQWACPKAVGLPPHSVRSVKERRATFAAIPGCHDLRPSARADALGGIDNLVLAGDWCDTGWPATMEGAVRSGFTAAAVCIGHGGQEPDLPIAPLARWMGLR